MIFWWDQLAKTFVVIIIIIIITLKSLDARFSGFSISRGRTTAFYAHVILLHTSAVRGVLSL